MKKWLQKLKNIEQQRCVSLVLEGGTPVGGMVKLSTFLDPLNVMNYANFSSPYDTHFAY
jgi:hypothetical protein